ncbi:MAG: FAD-dependent oxidoreductase [Candidatus Latescibacterota bacterium]|nr:FAD-dependent oxidoreductase [Candidatus Latescibacterota bacterium]
MHVLICGGGVIGACTAYYLAHKGVDVTVIERSGVANAASGKSGGFLALDWCDGSEMELLARHSFALHQELATELGRELQLDWGYRQVETLSVVASQERDLQSLARQSALDWLGPAAHVHDRIGSPATTAQLDPERFTKGMMDAARQKGAQVQVGTVEGIELSEDGQLATAAIVDGESRPADALVIAMGPWSILACAWLPLPGIFGIKGHSIIYRFEPSSNQTLFLEIETTEGQIENPEVVPRADGTTYICGLSSQALMPVDPARVESDEGAIERLQELTAAFSPQMAASQVLASQACHRPVTEDGLPLIGAVPEVGGAYVATGHGVWGMLNGPATGQAMADLIVDGSTPHVDLAPFNPGRLARFDPDRLNLR